VCPTEGVLADVPNKVTHDCGGGTSSSSMNSGVKGASKYTRTDGRCRHWCIEPKYKGPDKYLECMPSGYFSVYTDVPPFFNASLYYRNPNVSSIVWTNVAPFIITPAEAYHPLPDRVLENSPLKTW
jgi:hypothetical protein